MIVFSDLHLSEDSAETVFQKVLPSILNAAANSPDREIAFLGDWWHVRYKVPVALQNKVAEWLRELRRAGVTLILLPGNHDQINGAGENALEVFADLPHVTVVTEPAWNQYGLWIPYRKDRADVERALGITPPAAPARAVLWMHHGIRGAQISRAVLDSEGLDPVAFDRWGMVLCGHYHRRQVLRNIIYVGSPYQVTAAEAGDQKGYGVWDRTTGEFLWIDTVWGKRYHDINLSENNARDYLQARVASPGDEVRIRGGNAQESEELVKAFSDQGAHCVAEVAPVPVELRLDVGPGASLEAYASAFAAKMLDPAEVEAALGIYREITQP